MPSEDHKNMKKIQAWIPQDTWDKIVSLGYTSPAIAVSKAFEKLLEDPLCIPIGSPEDPREIPGDPFEIPEISSNIPNVPEIPVLNARIEGLQMILEEKDKRIESLENDLKKADLDKEDLKQMHNNYFLQVQLLINQKAIRSPMTGKQAVREDKPAPKEKPQQKAEKPIKKAEKELVEKTCKHCNHTFFSENPRKETCSDSCRQAYSRASRKK